MIVLLLSIEEVDALIKGTADHALKDYLARERRMEALLPDSNLPAAVLLRQVELVEGGRSYAAVVRTYDTPEAADRAFSEVIESIAKPDPQRPLFLDLELESA